MVVRIVVYGRYMNKALPKERYYELDRSIGVKNLFKAFSRLPYNAI